MEQNTKRVIEILQLKLEPHEDILDKWTREFAKDPCYSLRWGDNVFHAVTCIEVYNEIIESLKSTDFSNAVRYSKHKALNDARFPYRSTSPTANLIHEERTQAWAEVLEILEG